MINNNNDKMSQLIEKKKKNRYLHYLFIEIQKLLNIISIQNKIIFLQELLIHNFLKNLHLANFNRLIHFLNLKIYNDNNKEL